MGRGQIHPNHDRRQQKIYKAKLSLVNVRDLKEIVGIFDGHGIEVEKGIWKRYFE